MPEEEKIKTDTKKDSPDQASEDGLVFFKVMPKIKKGAMVMPEIKSTNTEQPIGLFEKPGEQPGQPQGPAEIKKSFLGRFKYFFFAILFFALAAAAYFVLPKFFVKDYMSESLLPVSNIVPAAKTDAAKVEWLKKYFQKADCDKAVCGEKADPDLDGLTNEEEYEKKTDPNNADSDKDGLSDGDEANIFGSNPLDDHSGVNKSYFDQDYAKGGYNFVTDKPYTQDELAQISINIKKFGLHDPTLKTLEPVLGKIYKYSPNQGATTSPETIKNVSPSTTPATTTLVSTNASSTDSLDLSPEAKQDRDTQRSLTIKNIGIALVKYYDDNKAYPNTTNFQEMFDTIKPYLKIATDPHDPLNYDKYIYAYSATPKADDFTLSYYSETLNQLIKKTSKNARDDKLKDEASVLNDQRRRDLDSLRSTLLVYSDDNIAGNQTYVFPTKDKYKTALVPKYISNIPKDPKTNQDYDYQVSLTFDTFTLKALYDLPPTGKTGYLCNQEECRDY